MHPKHWLDKKPQTIKDWLGLAFLCLAFFTLAGQAGRLLEAVCAERSKGERRVLVFRHGAEGFLRTAWLRRALYDQMEGLVVFNSPEYRDPFHPGQGENFLKAVWERIEQSQTPCTEKGRKRWFGR